MTYVLHKCGTIINDLEVKECPVCDDLKHNRKPDKFVPEITPRVLTNKKTPSKHRKIIK
jgi:hypothetical protein